MKRSRLIVYAVALLLLLMLVVSAQSHYKPQLIKRGVSVDLTSPAPEFSDDVANTEVTPEPTDEPKSPEILPTTISGGLIVKNNTSYEIEPSEILSAGCPVKLKADKPQVLIIHTHSSEAYSPAGLDRYVDSGASRTQDNNYNVIRVGEELTKVLTQCGINVIHDCGVYDYPSYAGSYTRSEEATIKQLKDNPSISVVIDLHRDAIGTDDVIYKTVAAEEGVCASQLMILVGSDEYGLEHPNWMSNLSLAVYLQNAVVSKYPSLMRPIILVPYRYNQHLTGGSFILEVGSNGNTLQEALAAVRLFGKAIGPALVDLIE